MMDNEKRDRVLLKILESLDKIRRNTDLLVSAAQGSPRGLPKIDREIIDLLGNRQTLGPRPLDDTIKNTGGTK